MDINNNEMIFARAADKIRVPVCDKTLLTELSDDFTLPDYRAEIRRLLKITASLPAPSVYTGGGSAEFSGDAVYHVLYVGGDGKLYSVDLTSMYEAAAELEGDEREELRAFDETEIESIVGRVTAPRKLNIRCRLRHRITASAERAIDVETSGATEDGIVRLAETCPVVETVYADDDSGEIVEMLNGVTDPRVAFSDATVLMAQVAPRQGGILCSGNLLLSVFSESEEGELHRTDRKLPFESVIPADISGDGWDCRAWGCASEIRTEPAANGLECRIRLSLFGEAQRNMPVKLTRDIYSTRQSCEVESEEIEAAVAEYCGIGNFTVSGSVELSGLPENCETVFATATAEPEELMAENGRYILTGKCRFSALLGGEEYACREFELPFRYEFGSVDGNEVGDYCAKLSCHAVRVRGDGGTLMADAEISAAMRVQSACKLEAVTRASFGEMLDTEHPLYSVVYVPRGESLWSIAKKYAADPTAVAEANGLRVGALSSPEALEGVNFLII